MSIKYLLSPFTWFWLSFVVAIGLSLAKRKKAAAIIGYIDLFLLLLVSTPWFPKWALATLERQYPSLLHAPPQAGGYHILVLGHGHRFDSSLSYADRLDMPALARLSEGIRLYRENPGSKLILSGYAGNSPYLTQADMLGRAAIELGVPATDTLLQREPTITYEEAQAYKARHGTRHPLLLVTSAAHMPRAMMLFRSQGLRPIAAPGNHLVRMEPGRREDGWPGVENIILAQGATREWSGILYTKLSLLSKPELDTLRAIELEASR